MKFIQKFFFKNIFSLFLFFFLYNCISCRIMIRTPEKLSKQFVSKKYYKIIWQILIIDETIKNSVSSFGRIPYGHKIEGRLLFDINNQLGCEPFNREAREDPLVGESPFIMVFQGTCNIIEKIKNIEKSGGHLAIIISEKDDDIGGIFMANERLGNDISIPVVLISNSDGNKLVEYYKLHAESHEDIKEIKLEVKFENENKDNKVKYDIWYSPDQESAYIFLNEFKNYQDALGENAVLGVHFFTYPYYDYTPDNRQIIFNCFGSGLYCSKPGKSGVKSGIEILKESLRQKCIYNYAYENKEKNNKNLFWDYLQMFHKNCVSVGKIDLSCSEDIQKNLKIPINDIQKCYRDSFIGEEKDKNTKDYETVLKNSIFDSEYELRKKNFISKSPSITINDRIYLGRWKADSLFDSLCSSLILKPLICYTEKNFNKKVDGVNLSSFLSIILVILFINVLLFLVCRTVIKKGVEYTINSSSINTKIDNMVGSYLNLRDTAPAEE